MTSWKPLANCLWRIRMTACGSSSRVLSNDGSRLRHSGCRLVKWISLYPPLHLAECLIGASHKAQRLTRMSRPSWKLHPWTELVVDQAVDQSQDHVLRAGLPSCGDLRLRSWRWQRTQQLQLDGLLYPHRAQWHELLPIPAPPQTPLGTKRNHGQFLLHPGYRACLRFHGLLYHTQTQMAQ